MNAPLADKIRPEKIEDVVGQQHLLGENMVLRNIIESKKIPNMVFYGPSGVGKTTVAGIISKISGKTLYKLNGTSAGISDIKEIVNELNTFKGIDGVLLYLDEIQYFNKKQQQSLLEYIENGQITLIASTTENPYFYIYNAILSRCIVFEFKPVEKEDIKKALKNVSKIVEKEENVTINADEEVFDYLASSAGGDVRKAINAFEVCLIGAKAENNIRIISMEHAVQVSQKSSMRYDKGGDEHYDILSAFQKSLRGSDPDAAIHYLARLIEAGDLISICRRLMICACEDVGLAYPMIIPIVKACVDSAFQVGLPEAMIPLADAVILVAISPKSNTGVNAIGAALQDIRTGKNLNIPDYLKDSNYSGAKKMGRGIGYLYPHDYENSYIYQEYLPDALKNEKYYEFGKNKTEQAAKTYWENIKNKKK